MCNKQRVMPNQKQVLWTQVWEWKVCIPSLKIWDCVLEAFSRTDAKRNLTRPCSKRQSLSWCWSNVLWYDTFSKTTEQWENPCKNETSRRQEPKIAPQSREKICPQLEWEIVPLERNPIRSLEQDDSEPGACWEQFWWTNKARDGKNRKKKTYVEAMWRSFGKQHSLLQPRSR